MATARRVWADIRERQTATCDRIGSLTDALWEHTKVLAAEMANPNRKVVTPAPSRPSRPGRRHSSIPGCPLRPPLIPFQNAAPENPRWEDQYHELKRAMGMSMGRWVLTAAGPLPLPPFRRL